MKDKTIEDSYQDILFYAFQIANEGTNKKLAAAIRKELLSPTNVIYIDKNLKVENFKPSLKHSIVKITEYNKKEKTSSSVILDMQQCKSLLGLIRKIIKDPKNEGIGELVVI